MTSGVTSLSLGFLLAFFLLEISQNHVVGVASKAVEAVGIKASTNLVCKNRAFGIRKLLPPSTSTIRPTRGRGNKCSTSEINVYQGAGDPLPNGIPTYLVQIVNVCSTGCSIANIHLSCGWFSTARLIDPKLFKRLSHNDCIVNNGDPIPFGHTLSFQYANSFCYDIAVSSLTCS